MKFLKHLFIVILASSYSWQPLTAAPHDIPSSIRFTLEREEKEPPIVYYFNRPDSDSASYPIAVLCDGSDTPGDLRSVFYIRSFFAQRVEALNLGYLTLEKWGIDGNQIDENAFWNHYSRSQRLHDHLRVIHYFEENPPVGWNGKFIFIGVSEGGPLVTDLSSLCSNALATINWAGATDCSWADDFWQFFESLKQNGFPVPSDIPPTREQYDALVQQIIHNPTFDQHLGGMTYLYLADAFQRPPPDYAKIYAPFLVVMGTKDPFLASCDQFVQKAQKVDAPITYLRVEDMDHYIRLRPDVIDQSFSWLQKQLSSQTDCTIQNRLLGS